MKSSFIQIFDTKSDAESALGFITKTYPTHKHHMVNTSNQVQVWTSIKGINDAKVYGEPNDKVVYMIVSIAPD